MTIVTDLANKSESRKMNMSLLDEMRECKTIDDCIEVATVDTYGEEEQISGWLACIEEMFGTYESAYVFGEEVKIKKFDILNDRSIVGLCQKGSASAKIALESLEFPKINEKEKLWLDAWKTWSE